MKKNYTSIFTKSSNEALLLYGKTVAVDSFPGISKLSNPETVCMGGDISKLSIAERQRVFERHPKGGVSLTSLVKVTVLIAALFVLPQLQPPAVQAQQVPQQVINGLFSPTGAERFFLEGERNFDREIKILIQNRLSFPDSLLEIDDDLGRQQKLLQLENHHLQLDNADTSGLRQFSNFNDKELGNKNNKDKDTQ